MTNRKLTLNREVRLMIDIYWIKTNYILIKEIQQRQNYEYKRINNFRIDNSILYSE